MPRFEPRASSSNKPGALWRGLTLIELLVVLVVLSILAVSAMPFAEIMVRRSKELELRRDLREVRTAIDRFHADWEAERISRISELVSEDGYPKTLQVLVEGVPTGKASGASRKYLRRIPEDPFGGPGRAAAEQWVLRSYRDDVDSDAWGGEDVYDLRSGSERTGIDGSRYQEW